jgi:hypothetical protein
LGHIQIPTSSVAIGTTPIVNQILSAGLYRVSYYLTTLQADNTGSSVQVGIAWTDRGATKFINGAAMTANSVTAGNQSGTLLLRIDRSTPITYGVNYSSTGGSPKMIYSLDVMIEQVVNLP